MRRDSFSAYLEAPQRLQKQGLSRAESEIVTDSRSLSPLRGGRYTRGTRGAGGGLRAADVDAARA